MRGLKKIRQAGLSLVETMIAMTLGAIVTVGVIQLFTANSETYNLMQGQSRMQESARFALDFMARGIQQAGYKGCFSQNEDVFTTLLADTNVPYEFFIHRGLTGYEAQGAAWNPVLTPLDATFVAGNAIDTSAIVPGTDVLTVRYLSQTTAGLTDDMLVDSDDVPTDIPFADLDTVGGAEVWGDEFGEGDLIAIHDCEKATVFKVTGMVNDGAGNTALQHAQGVASHDNSIDGLAEINTYEDDSEVSAIRTATFFIAPGAGVNNLGNTPLSLWRKFGTAAPVELVEGVEDLQVLYGVDTDGDITPNQYLTANLVTDYTNVSTVRISIVVNSVDDVDATSPPTHGCIADGGEQECISGETYDGLIRRTFHQTVQLRNNG